MLISCAEFVRTHPQYLAEDNSLEFISDNHGYTFNLCHCERLSCLFLTLMVTSRSQTWTSGAVKHTQHSSIFLTRAADFTTTRCVTLCEAIVALLKRPQRWGDAPVHTIVLALFLPRSQLHFFEQIGYEHEPYMHCPRGEQWALGRCLCDPERSPFFCRRCGYLRVSRLRWVFMFNEMGQFNGAAPC